MTAETPPQPVHCHIEIHHFGCVLKHVQLLHTPHQSAYLYPDEPDEHAPLPETPEEILCLADEQMVKGGVGYPLLQRVSVKIRVAYAHRET